MSIGPGVSRFILYHGKRHPRDMGVAEVEAFLSHLAVGRNVSAATQNQAKCALLFLYREVLGTELPWMSEAVCAKLSRRLPVVLTEREVRELLLQLHGVNGLIAALHVKDLADGRGEVWLPDALAQKYPRAGVAWGWQFVFPSAQHAIDPRSGVERRHHLTEQAVQPSRAEPQLRHAHAAGGLRHPHRAGIAGPRGRVHHADLHPCHEPGRSGRAQPVRQTLKRLHRR